MAEFYVEKTLNASGQYVVHNSVCGELPAKESLQYLGARSNAEAPLKEAALFQYSPTTPCPHCISA